MYEAISALLADRMRLDIYLSALEVFTQEGRFVIEWGLPSMTTRIGGAVWSGGARIARHVVELVSAVPRPVWGRDDLGAGEMWTCN
jgi:hypothetical protein